METAAASPPAVSWKKQSPHPPETTFGLCSHPPESLSGVPIRHWGSHWALIYLLGPPRSTETLLATVHGVGVPILLLAHNYPS